MNGWSWRASIMTRPASRAMAVRRVTGMSGAGVNEAVEIAPAGVHSWSTAEPALRHSGNRCRQLIRVAVADDPPRAQLVPVFELVAPCSNLEHGLANLRRLDGGAERGEEPVQQVLAEVSLGRGRADVVRSPGDDPQALIASRARSNSVVSASTFTRAHICRESAEMSLELM